MNNGLKKVARALLYRGGTQKIYEKLSRRKTEKLASMSDEEYIRYRYREDVGGELDLDHPKTLNEKLNWLKLHDIHPEYGRFVDKYQVKQYVKETVGEQYVIPCLGVWDNAADIDFDSLPDKFVLKATHDSGGRVICTDKSKLDINEARETLQRLIDTEYYNISREYPYKYATKRIIAEPYIESLGNDDHLEYKLTMMNGKMKMFTVCHGKAHGMFSERTNDHYDENGNIMPFYAFYKNADPHIPMPKESKEMIEIAEKLAGDIPYVRVDFYIDNGQILFGEMTFFTWGGFIIFTPKEWDLKLGEMLKLPEC